MNTAIEATEIAKTYKGGVEALKGVTFRVGWGEIFSYLGRNGSGKTTTSRILSTLTNPTSGSATVAGHDVATEPDAVRRSIGVTMQEAALDNLMTGREHLELVGGIWGLSGKEARRRSDELLEQFGLAEAAKRLISTYSGGMRGRLDIATALISHPRILVLAEPTTGLDPQGLPATRNENKTRKADGGGYVHTQTHVEAAYAPSGRGGLLEGATDKRDGMGATVAWLDRQGDAPAATARVRVHSGSLSSHEPVLRFGLGEASDARGVEVTWPSGAVERFSDLALDTIHHLRQGSGTPVERQE